MYPIIRQSIKYPILNYLGMESKIMCCFIGMFLGYSLLQISIYCSQLAMDMIERYFEKRTRNSLDTSNSSGGGIVNSQDPYKNNSDERMTETGDVILEFP